TKGPSCGFAPVRRDCPLKSNLRTATRRPPNGPFSNESPAVRKHLPLCRVPAYHFPPTAGLRRPPTSAGHAPDGITDVIDDEQRAASVHGDAHGPTLRMAIGGDEAAEDVDRRPGRHAGPERHEDHFVAAARLA